MPWCTKVLLRCVVLLFLPMANHYIKWCIRTFIMQDA
jgi:hypothetical protein